MTSRPPSTARAVAWIECPSASAACAVPAAVPSVAQSAPKLWLENQSRPPKTTGGRKRLNGAETTTRVPAAVPSLDQRAEPSELDGPKASIRAPSGKSDQPLEVGLERSSGPTDAVPAAVRSVRIR